LFHRNIAELRERVYSPGGTIFTRSTHRSGVTAARAPMFGSSAVAGLRSETASERKMRKILRDPELWIAALPRVFAVPRSGM
jgi:hypothetical protein